MSVMSPSGPIMHRVDVTTFSRSGSSGGLVTCAHASIGFFILGFAPDFWRESLMPVKHLKFKHLMILFKVTLVSKLWKHLQYHRSTILATRRMHQNCIRAALLASRVLANHRALRRSSLS